MTAPITQTPAILALDAEAFYDELAATISAYGFDAEKVDTGGGVLAVAVRGTEPELLIGGVQDGFLVVSTDEGPDDGADLSLAECVGRAIVQRINLDEVPTR